MFEAVIAFVGGFKIDRIWPHGFAFVALVAMVAVASDIAANWLDGQIGLRYPFDALDFAIGLAVAMLIAVAFFALGRGLRWLLTRRQRR